MQVLRERVANSTLVHMIRDYKRLRVLRAQYGWSQTDLGKLLGVSRFVIHRLETGKTPLDTRTKLAVETLIRQEQQR